MISPLQAEPIYQDILAEKKTKTVLVWASSLGSSFFSSSSNNPLNKQHAVNLAT